MFGKACSGQDLFLVCIWSALGDCKCNKSFLFPGIKLRPYQLEGVNWLVQCYEVQHGCILGDEMGLGKTCQVCLLLLENDLCFNFWVFSLVFL